MSSIFHGGNTYIFYNTDANNNIPTSVNYKSIDELGAFPQVKINSSTTSLETYNDEWVQVLSSNMSIDSVSIVVHYLADNESHQYLDNAFSNQTNFQIKVSLYESQDSLDQHYVILNGYISAYSDSGDQDEVYNRTYTFVAEDLLARGTAQDPPQLKQGDFGIGADGETYPQYESDTPSGNSFIKVPALRTDNPINGDLGGFAFVDNGGDKTAQLAMPSDGNLGIYIKNTDNDWLSVPLKSTNDGLYVPLTRTINGKVLSSNITLSKSDIGLSAVSNDAQLKITSNLSDLANVATARTNLDVYSKAEADGTASTLVPKTTTVNGQALSGNVTVTAGDVGLGNVLNAVQLVASDNLSDLANVATARTNLDVYSKAEAVPSTLTVNGKALNTNIALTSSDTGSYSIANNLSEGVPATIRTNIGAAKSGSNSDITMLTALSGPLTLGGDAQQDAQAVTLRQLIAATAGGGSSGATLNGVMNNFLGAVEWFLGTRGAMPSGHLAADGQLLSRAAYPDLWNAISTGVLQSITDASWQSTPTGRGSYSTGDGSTTFRMPDLNGVWTHPTDSTLNSIPALFLRGDGAVANTGNGVGVIRWGAVPNITGNINIIGNGTSGGSRFNVDYWDGAFKRGTNSTGSTKDAYTTGNNTSYAGGIGLDASQVNSSYGRDSSTEVRPNSVKGVWLIRVNGMFSASNTNFNVINGITAAPATGAVVYGGDVISNLQLNGSNYAVARMRSKIVGGSSPVVAIGLANSTGSSVVNTEWTLPATGGELVQTSDARLSTINGKSGGIISSGITSSVRITSVNGTLANGGPLLQAEIKNQNNISIFTQLFPEFNGGQFSQSTLSNYDSGTGQNKYWQFRSDGSAYAVSGSWINSSDSNVKNNQETINNPLDLMSKFRGKTWTRKDTGEFGIGFIAQEVQHVFPDAVKVISTNYKLPDGTIIDNYLGIDTGSIAAGLHHEAILALMEQIETMKAQIEALQSKLEDK